MVATIHSSAPWLAAALLLPGTAALRLGGAMPRCWVPALAPDAAASSVIAPVVMCLDRETSSSEEDGDSLSSTSSVPLDDALRMLQAAQTLHTRQVAAAEQVSRLRKGESPTVDAEDVDGTKRTVYLVGVGPGDVELLTLKALRLMQTADLVLYDRLISPEILQLVGDDAKMLYVGKEAGLHTRPQDEIHELLLHFAEAGKTVVRLKGGDPTVFGRGGEEMEYLEDRGVRVRVVPGITAASGIAATLGVPLTHRDHADSVRFITGHSRSECSAPVEERYPWAQLADPKTTLVIYMGLSTLPELAKGLVDAGLDAATPAVAVQDGTTPTQRVVHTPLGELPKAVEEAGLRSPTLVVIGSVVSMLDTDAAAAAAVAAAASAAAHGTAWRAEDLLALPKQAPQQPTQVRRERE